MITAVIYTITHPATPQAIYIGQSLSFRKRKWQHRRDAARNTTQRRLYNWWNKRVRETGVEPVLTVLRQAVFATREEAVAWMNAVEAELVAQARNDPRVVCLNSVDGGGQHTGPTPELRQKISERRRGRHHTPETKAKCGAIRRGAKLTEEHRAAIVRANRGRRHRPESIAKMRARTYTGEQRRAMSLSRRKISPEQAAEAVTRLGTIAKAARELGVAWSTVYANVRCQRVDQIQAQPGDGELGPDV